LPRADPGANPKDAEVAFWSAAFMIDLLILKLLQQTFMPKMHQNTFGGRAPPGLGRGT